MVGHASCALTASRSSAPRQLGSEPGTRRGATWRQLRTVLLLLVLAIVAAQAWYDRVTTTSWRRPLWIGIYPLNGDDTATTEAYLHSLSSARFADIERFFATQAQRYGIRLDSPVHVELYPPPARPPPLLTPGADLLHRVWWSLQLRWYAAHAPHAAGQAPPQIRVFVLYHDPQTTPSVPHSLGLSKGLIGVVYAFAHEAADGSNNMVITHEVMHTLGATDKYDPDTDGPLYPYGFADPDQRPLYPQRRAEIMAGRYALTRSQFVMPDSLEQVVVGPLTAAEIRWTRP